MPAMLRKINTIKPRKSDDGASQLKKWHSLTKKQWRSITNKSDDILSHVAYVYQLSTLAIFCKSTENKSHVCFQ